MASYIQKAKEESLPLQFTELDADRKQHDMLIPLIKLDTKKGSLYYTDDHTAYYATYLIGKHQIIAHGMEEEYIREDTTTHINGIE
jgi:hypothetical protein